MAAIFAGASHALLASVVFAFETTRQPLGLLPLLAGCSAAYLVSLLLMRSSIMTEKLARRGARVRTEYAADYLEQVLVRDASSREVVSLRGDDRLADVRAGSSAAELAHRIRASPCSTTRASCAAWSRAAISSTQHDAETADDRSLVRRGAVVVFDDNTLREAADHMVRAARRPAPGRHARRAARRRRHPLAERSAVRARGPSRRRARAPKRAFLSRRPGRGSASRAHDEEAPRS